MPRPYNKKTVADALLLLDIYASNGASFEDAARGAEVRPSSTGYRVAEKLVGLVADVMPEEIIAVVAGEAAGLLREGWRIGDEIPKHPNVAIPATLKNVDAILREQFPAANVEAMASSPNVFDLSSIERGAVKPIVFNDGIEASVGYYANYEPTPIVATIQLAEPLDAVEEPTDEEIGTDWEKREDPTHDNPYGMDDTTEPSE